MIAEIGVNYYDIAIEQNCTPMEAAKLMISEAAKAGIHAVKFQTYKAETLASKNSPYYWDIREEPMDSQYKLFKKFDSFGFAEYAELAQYAEDKDVEFLSTPFDVNSADYLESLMNVYKISSSDLNNLKFIEYQAKKNKPIILSVGASNEDEIERTVELIRKYNDKMLVLMHCVLEYPTPYEHANLNKIESLKNKYPDLVIGYSDHTKPDANYDVLKTAFNLGAQVIEKHFTLDKTLKGNDHYHAMDVRDAENIISGIEFLSSMRGKGELVCLDTEQKARQNARRSLVAAKLIHVGEVITADMLTWKRPGTGICVDRFDELVGKVALEEICEDTVLQWSMIKDGDNLIATGIEKETDNAFFKEKPKISYKCSIKDVEFGKYTNVAHHAQIADSKIGKRTSVGRYAKVREAEIGKYCSISWDVTIGAVSHPSERITSHAFTYREQFGICEKDIMIPQKKTIIGNDVWIGCNSVILSGVKVGDGAIIGAGAVVTKDVEPYSVVAGVPAHVIKYRFERNIIKKLEQMKWWDLSDEVIRQNQHLFAEKLTIDVLNEIEKLCNEKRK